MAESLEKIYEDKINAWHSHRVSVLKSDGGWLTVVAREWLKEGVNHFSNFGTISVKSGKVTAQLADTSTGMLD